MTVYVTIVRLFADLKSDYSPVFTELRPYLLISEHENKSISIRGNSEMRRERSSSNIGTRETELNKRTKTFRTKVNGAVVDSGTFSNKSAGSL